MQVIYEDNHIIVVNKAPGEIVQADKTGDIPLKDLVARYLVEKYQKPGDAFVGVVHRLDRPVGGLVLFAKTSKALARMNRLFKEGAVHKRYRAIVAHRPTPPTGEARHWLLRNRDQNKSFPVAPHTPEAKESILYYNVVAASERYYLVDIELVTGRHHQIRAQMAAMGCPIKGDLKYGAPRSNADSSISLQSYRLSFVHPVSKEEINLEAPPPDDPLWQILIKEIK